MSGDDAPAARCPPLYPASVLCQHSLILLFKRVIPGFQSGLSCSGIVILRNAVKRRANPCLVLRNSYREGVSDAKILGCE